MKKVILVFVAFSFIQGVIFPDIVAVANSYGDNEQTGKNHFFQSNIESSIWDFQEDEMTTNSNNTCPMCGTFSFGGGVCNSCNYSSGSALGVLNEVSLGMDLSVWLFGSICYWVFLTIRKKYNNRSVHPVL